jgi:hypothetical protein
MAAQSVVEAAAEASSIGKTGQPVHVVVHVKWLGSNALFTTDVLDLYASSHVDGASQAAMLQQKLAQLMPKPPLWHGQVCLRAETGVALTMHPNNLKDYLNAFEHTSRPPKTAAQTKLDKAWDALAKNASSTVPITLYATQYSSVDAAIAWLQLKKPNEHRLHRQKRKLDFHKSLDQATKDNPRVVLCCYDQNIYVDCSAKVNALKQVVLKHLSHKHYGRIGGIPIGSVPDHVLHDKEVSEAILEQNDWDPECFAKYNLLKCKELQKYAQVMFDVKRKKLHKPANTYSRNDVLQRVKMNGNALKLHVQYTDDKEIVLAAASSTRITLSLRFLAWLAPDMQNDKDVVCAALQNGASIEGASIRLQGDLRVARVAMTHTASDLEHVSDKLRKHRGLVLAACRLSGRALKHAHEAFKDDLEVVLVACRSSAEAIEFVSPRLRKNKRVFLAVCTSMNSRIYVYYPLSFRKYVLEFSAFFQTAMPSNKIVKQAIEKDLIGSDWWSAATLNRFLTKSTVMWFIKAKPEVAVKFFDKHGVRRHLDFACKCVYSNWKLYGLLQRNYRQLTDYERDSMQMGNHERERLRSAAIAGFGPAKAAAVHWMDFANGWQTVLTARDWP